MKITIVDECDYQGHDFLLGITTHRKLVVPEECMELALISLTEMRRQLTENLASYVEHVGVKWSTIYLESDVPVPIFTFKFKILQKEYEFSFNPKEHSSIFHYKRNFDRVLAIEIGAKMAMIVAQALKKRAIFEHDGFQNVLDQIGSRLPAIETIIAGFDQ